MNTAIAIFVILFSVLALFLVVFVAWFLETILNKEKADKQ